MSIEDAQGLISFIWISLQAFFKTNQINRKDVAPWNLKTVILNCNNLTQYVVTVFLIVSRRDFLKENNILKKSYRPQTFDRTFLKLIFFCFKS